MQSLEEIVSLGMHAGGWERLTILLRWRPELVDNLGGIEVRMERQSGCSGGWEGYM